MQWKTYSEGIVSAKYGRQMIELKADKNCKFCHGSGTVYDWVPYGSTNVSMPSDCECVFDSATDEELKLIDKGAEFRILEQS